MNKYQTSSEMVLFVKKLFRFISHKRIVIVSVDLKRIKVKDRSKYAGTRVNWLRNQSINDSKKVQSFKIFR